jgi:hypothetical protein
MSVSFSLSLWLLCIPHTFQRCENLCLCLSLCGCLRTHTHAISLSLSHTHTHTHTHTQREEKTDLFTLVPYRKHSRDENQSSANNDWARSAEKRKFSLDYIWDMVAKWTKASTLQWYPSRDPGSNPAISFAFFDFRFFSYCINWRFFRYLFRAFEFSFLLQKSIKNTAFFKAI